MIRTLIPFALRKSSPLITSFKNMQSLSSYNGKNCRDIFNNFLIVTYLVHIQSSFFVSTLSHSWPSIKSTSRSFLWEALGICFGSAGSWGVSLNSVNSESSFLADVLMSSLPGDFCPPEITNGSSAWNIKTRTMSTVRPSASLPFSVTYALSQKPRWVQVPQACKQES